MPEKIIIGISVENKIAKADKNAVIVCGNSNYKAVFAFDGEWESYNVKTALFATENGDNGTIAVVFEGNECDIPPLTNTTIVGVGVASGDLTQGEEVELATTTPAYIGCLLSIKDLGGITKPPAPDVYDQIIALLNKYLGQGGGGSGGVFDEERVRGIVAEETADLQGKTDEGLETESKQVVGAINELERETLKQNEAIAGTYTANSIVKRTEVGTIYANDPRWGGEVANKRYVDERADTLSTELAVINTVLEQSGLVSKYKATIEDTYTERVTADGANVLDGSKAVLKKVVGNTVRYDADENGLNGKLANASFGGIESGGKNLFDTSFITNKTYANGSSVTVNADGSIHVIKKAGNSINFRTKTYLPAGTYTLSNGLSVGSSVYIQFHNFATMAMRKITFDWEGGEADVYLYSDTNIDGVDITLYPQIEHGTTATEYTPYISPYLYEFPKTETPLGTTIDFETKKITDYGADLVLTGTEAIELFTSYSTEFGYGVNITNVLSTGTTKAVGVCTDAVVGTLNTSQAVMQLGLTAGGNIFPNIYWAGVLKTLGIYTGAEQPTGETLTTAVANFKAYLAQRYADGNPVKIRYVSSVLQSESDFTADNEYTAYKSGTETVLDNDGKDYGADNTLSQNYIIVTGVK